jgi:hypothetical protein
VSTWRLEVLNLSRVDPVVNRPLADMHQFGHLLNIQRALADGFSTWNTRKTSRNTSRVIS